jgi:hypothetical protein
MTSIIKVDNLQNQCGANIISESANVITIGASGDTVTLAAGASQSGFGRTGTVNWDTTAKTTTVTAVSGVGYFVNTTSGSVTVNLPAGVAGSIVAVSDYANTAATNKIVVSPNSTDKIQGVNTNYEITVNGGTVTLVYVDSTQGWRPTDAATASSITEQPQFVAATGGTVTCCGNYKIHTFTGPGTFTVTNAGNPSGSTTVDYMVIAGGGAGGGFYYGAGGGAGGFRESVPSPAAWTASPLASPGGSLPVSATGYPITIGAGGTSAGQVQGNVGTSGNNSIFSTITSAGGGRGGTSCGPGGSPSTPSPGANGGSGGGAGGDGGSPSAPTGTGGVGNTPPVSPPQGNTGGIGYKAPAAGAGGGGGGATSVGANASPNAAGNGGTGAGTAINSSPTVGTPGPSAPLRYFAGGGGGGVYASSNRGTGGTGGGGAGGSHSPQVAPVNGTTNTGGGGGGRGTDTTPCTGGSGGSGIVVIRYKFQ